MTREEFNAITPDKYAFVQTEHDGIMLVKKPVRLMKCSDIEDYPILIAIANRQYYSSFGSTLHDLAHVMWENVDYDIAVTGCSNYDDLEVLPYNLVKAKMRRLIKRGLVHGCACGCRGDFTLTVKGNMELASYYIPAEKLSN